MAAALFLTSSAAFGSSAADICSPELERESICSTGARGSWGILHPGGRVSGGYSSRAKAQRKIDKYQRYTECVCAHGDWSFKCFSPPNCSDRPAWVGARPVCLACGSSQERRNAALDTARRALDLWEKKLRDTLGGLIGGRLRTHNPVGGVGTTIGEYADLVGEAARQTARLKDMLDRAHERAFDKISAAIDDVLDELDHIDGQLKAIRVRLPQEISNELETAERDASRHPPTEPLPELVRKVEKRIAKLRESEPTRFAGSDGSCDGRPLYRGERCCRAIDQPDFFMVCTPGGPCPPMSGMRCDP